MRRFLSLIVLILVISAAATGSSLTFVVAPSGSYVPLTELGAGRYLGYAGGLYPGGRNAPPAAHHARGLEQSARVQPLDPAGRPSPSGRYVLLSIGMSNTSQEFCAPQPTACNPWTLMGRAAADPMVNHRELVIVNGAQSGQAAGAWDGAGEPNYRRIRDSLLAPRGLSERQVQVIWLKVATARPTIALPAEDADAVLLVTQMGTTIRALKRRYPNLRQVFLSSRTYGGYARIRLNPEPFAYESGFAVKWVIQAQIEQMAGRGAVRDRRAGDLNYTTVAPWIAWGPYLWTNGTMPRSDGLTWTPSDVERDGVHPSVPGEGKVGALLLEFFKISPYTRCWFLAGRSCS